MSQRLHHEVHPFVLVTEDSGHQMCICGLWDTHHLHQGVSSATCTCLECVVGREGKNAYLSEGRERRR